MLCTDSLLLLLITDVVALTGNEVDELGAAVQDQFPRVVGNSDVRQKLLKLVFPRIRI